MNEQSGSRGVGESGSRLGTQDSSRPEGTRSTQHSVYAVRYATRDARRGEHFYGGDPHDGPMPMDYFVWVAVSAEHTVVIDCGFTVETGQRRNRIVIRTPAEGLRLLGIDSAEVRHVILTHFHYDHVGNVAEFPNATFV